MRLRKLWLGNIYNLKQLTVPFDETRPIHAPLSIRFFCGANGSGKSHALEAVGLIFSHLASGVPIDQPFDLEYELGDRIIRVSNRRDTPNGISEKDTLPDLGVAISVRSRDSRPEDAQFLIGKSASDDILPDLIIGYSTGPTSGMRWALDQSVERWVKDEIGAISIEEQSKTGRREELLAELHQRMARHLDTPRALCLRAEEAEYAALALLAYPFDDMDDETKRLRRRILETVGLEQTTPLPSFAFHIVRGNLDGLNEQRQQRLREVIARATARRERLAATAEGPDDRSELSAIFDASPQRDQALRGLAPTPLAFFEMVLAWRRQGALRGISMLLNRHDRRGLLPSEALSDGEFLYLGRYALLFMIRSKRECLVLLDEPETHFNDRWKVELVHDICEFLGRAPPISTREEPITHEVLIATHSALTLTDADPRQVYVFGQGAQSATTSTARTGVMLTFGASVSEISRQIFLAPNAVGTYADKKLRQVIAGGSAEEVQRFLDEIAGIGVYRFYLAERLRTEAEEPTR